MVSESNPAPSSDVLLSVPPKMATAFADVEPDLAAECFAACDPPSNPLGSGGGTAHLLQEAFRAQAADESFSDWLRRSKKIVIHGGGQSRRLPAYAATGKLFVPMPASRGDLGQRLDQNLLQTGLPLLQRVASEAPERSRVMIVSGDAMLRTDKSLPEIPDADVVLGGLWATPEHARSFGVLFCDRTDPAKLVRFLQKPSVDEIRELSTHHQYMIDVGIWLLSERAVNLLRAKSTPGGDGEIKPYDMYGEWALHLGAEPAKSDLDFASLTTAVMPLAGAEFYHFGTNRDLIDSNRRLQNVGIDQTQMGEISAQAHPQQFILNSKIDIALEPGVNHTLWIENSHVAAGWTLHHEHAITGVPDNNWEIKLPQGRTLHFVPVEGRAYAIMSCGFDDSFCRPGRF